MKNLRVVQSLSIKHLTLCGIHDFTVDFDTGIVYCGNRHGIVGLDPSSREIVSSVSLVEHGYLPADVTSGKTIVGIEHLPDQMSVCVATVMGDLILWNTSTSEVECVGSVESGFTSMAWSPDQELVVLATGQKTLIMMTREFEPIIETPFEPSSFGDAQFVNVGWGKKETQFHGSEGKSAATKTKMAVSAALDWDSGLPIVSWRGDGQYFAVSSINSQTGGREIRVWSRECILYSTSEPVNGLEPSLCWKPSGSVITSGQRLTNQQELIVFFEKNGLQHGELKLPFAPGTTKLREITWNNDSTVLCLWLEELPPPEQQQTQWKPKSYIQLWCVNNYHWYLKQSLDFSSEQSVRCVKWDAEHSKRLHVATEGARYLQYTFAWCVNDTRDQALVAVIDGDQLLLTPFESLVVPPPMAAVTIRCQSAVNQVIFAPPPLCSIAVLLADGCIELYTPEKEDSSEAVDMTICGNIPEDVKLPQFRTTAKLCMNGSSRYPQKETNFIWLDTDFLVCAHTEPIEDDGSGGTPGGSTSSLTVLQLDRTTKQWNSRCAVAVEEGCVMSMCHSSMKQLLVQLNNGTLLDFHYDTDLEVGSVVPHLDDSGLEVVFPQPCIHMAVCTLGGQDVVVGLTERYRFYVNDIEIATNCTSFAVHDDYLLLTTHAHTCRCICRKTKLAVLPQLSDGKSHPFDESIRRIERGARIVTVVRDETKVVLQLPRGNLETIHPRALILSAIRRHIDKLQFKKAFTTMKKHRINLNLLFDHNPEVFLDNVAEFIEQIADITDINLFLTDLQEEDVTVTMYTAAYEERSPLKKNLSNKKDIACDAIRKVLEEKDADKYLLCILTAHVRKTKPELEVALKKIKELRDEKGTGVVSPEEALKYLLFLVDVNEMYLVALGTYDFDLVIMVAEKSQKDPKEYLPFLNKLRAMESRYMRYSIDMHLKRYPEALQHLVECGEERFTECMSLITERKLFKEALKYYPVASHQYKEISYAFGDHLKQEKCHEEAAIYFYKAEQYDSAIASNEKCLNWQAILCIMAEANYSEKEIVEESRKLAEQLKDAKRMDEAAILFEQYAGDCEEAIETLISGHHWADALRLIYKHNRRDFLETSFKPGLQEAYESLSITLQETCALFKKYTTRLEVVRAEKEKNRLEMIESGVYMQEGGDLYSDASSATGESIQSSRYTTDSQRSSSSKMSGKSSKNRRKTERKKWSLKEGSRHEDLALIDALATIISRTEQQKDEIGPLLKTLVQFHHEDKAAKLQQDFQELIKLVESSIADIWSPQEKDDQPIISLGPDATANSIVRSMQSKAGPDTDKTTQLDAVFRIPPVINKTKKWKLTVLGQ
ncbi:unnamed protein product [Owenia fusiformis]|uniref:Elongator complex protein 1 n=1 Tax=Owenia fusiformis TaxID=6347 RepID=A0A8S4PTV6_OWEFU|nr:unnamed protein product [Owenia fusiformis]